MIKEKSLFSLKFLAKTMLSEGYTSDEVRKFVTQVVFCFFCDNSALFFGKPFTGAVLTSPTCELAENMNRIFSRLSETMQIMRMRTVSRDVHRILKQCCAIDWENIHPGIFGAVCQSVMDAAEQKSSGAHYTSLLNVHRVIDNLFLDEMIAELEEKRTEPALLRDFYEQLCRKKFLDPACGCGNFLLETLSGLRLLEIELVNVLGEQDFGITLEKQIFGIEISPDAAELCRTALFIQDRLMDIQYAEQLGKPLKLIDFRMIGSVVCANALRTDWLSVADGKIDYIIGNPPFLMGKSKEQAAEIREIFDGSGRIDYSAAWIRKAAEYMSDEQSECAFITTNSVCQGCQVKTLWQPIIKDMGFHINFAFASFRWESDISNGKIDLSCVIVAFSRRNSSDKRIYSAGADNDSYISAKNINAYLFDGPSIYLENTNSGRRPQMLMGTERGFGLYRYTKLEAMNIIDEQPELAAQLARFVTAENMMSSEPEYVFSENGEQSDYIVIPRHSSERRKYIPIEYFSAVRILCSDSVHFIQDGNLYLFGLLCSAMHNAWTRQFCGRLDMRIRYSNTLIYGNFPFPRNVSEEQKAHISGIASELLKIRNKYASFLPLGKLYTEMPNDLLKAHLDLDMAVERLYRKAFFLSARERVEFLIEMYNDEHSLD